MKIVYLDCLSGISGDMTLAALVDAGVDLQAIAAGIDSLGLPSCRLVAEEVKRHGFRATNIRVEHEPEQTHRHLHQITDMIAGSRLTPRQKELAVRIFTRLGEAEAKVHGTTIREVHFHEVGAVDSIADIVGSAIGFDLLEVDRIACSPVPTGRGFITIAHGRVSIPAPATAELLTGVPLAASDAELELTTPTGAAIVAALAEQFGPLPAMTIDRIGYGAGDADLAQQPNVLRLVVGRTEDPLGSTADEIVVLETNLDDVSGELIGYCCETLLAAGALDVYTTAVQMKKNRPGTKLSVLSSAADVATLEELLFRETGTLGIRRWSARRSKLVRRPHTVTTPWGPVEGKLASLPQGAEAFAPEYESCRRLAAEKKIPLREIFQAARQAYRDQPADKNS